MQVHWTATTKRAKQLKAQHGVVWERTGLPQVMPCFNNNIGVQITSLDGTHVRNVPIEEIQGI